MTINVKIKGVDPENKRILVSFFDPSGADENAEPKLRVGFFKSELSNGYCSFTVLYFYSGFFPRKTWMETMGNFNSYHLK